MEPFLDVFIALVFIAEIIYEGWRIYDYSKQQG